MKPYGRPVNEVLSRLEQYVQLRNIREGFLLLDEVSRNAALGRQLQSANPISFALCLAQWMDLGYRDHKIFNAALERLPQRHPQMPFLDIMRLNLIDAHLCLSSEDPDGAIAFLDRTSPAGIGLMPDYLTFLTHFWKGRAHRKKGDYKQAAWHIHASQTAAFRLKNPKLVAVTKIHESWLVFQSGDVRRALHLLDAAEAELRPIGHALSLANIESARGRFVRRSGRYSEALEHFDKAIDLYKTDFAHHPNLARAMVNAAYVKRLMALDLRAGSNRGLARGALNSKYLRLTREALDLLKQAGQIYAHHHHQGGTGSVLVNSGFLHLESGDIEKASVEAERAFTLAREKRDAILMTRARTLQSAVARTKSEEGLDGVEDVYMNAKEAVELADEAIEMARRTENRRLLAEALLARGFAALDELSRDVQVARNCISEVERLLGEGDRDHLFRELGDLKERILRSVGVEDTLRRWSEGQIGRKRFQQVQEEFAEIVISRVWENLGRNVSKVSAQLSISPKKVRRLLTKRYAKMPSDARSLGRDAKM